MDYVADNIAPGIYFGEGPRWHEGELWFSDFFAHQIKVLDAKGTLRVAHQFDGQSSGLGWLPDGTLIAASMLDRRVVAHRNGRWETYADLSDLATFHINDLVVNANGDVYVGNFGFDLDGNAEPQTAVLALVKPDGAVHRASEGLQFPNGMVITPDGSTLIVAETMGQQLTAFDILPDGSLSNQRLWAAIPGLPDGICLDADGCVWVAAAAAPFCFRIAEGGEVKDQVSTQYGTYACMLGGKDGDELFIMTAPAHDAAIARLSPLGWVARAKVAVPRAGLP